MLKVCNLVFGCQIGSKSACTMQYCQKTTAWLIRKQTCICVKVICSRFSNNILYPLSDGYFGTVSVQFILPFSWFPRFKFLGRILRHRLPEQVFLILTYLRYLCTKLNCLGLLYLLKLNILLWTYRSLHILGLAAFFGQITQADFFFWWY